MSGNDTEKRRRRPEPARTAPDRSGWSAGTDPGDHAPHGAEAHDPDTLGTSPVVSEIVADAVRIGYDVIGLNLAQGRAAADRFSAGTYRVDDIPHDVSRLGKRLLQLSRDLSTTGFDLLGAVLNDPAIRRAIQPDGPPPAGDKRRRHTGPVTVTCVFKGRRTATAEPITLQQTEAPTMLAVAGLLPVVGEAPPITRVTFGPAHLGSGIIATIVIPDEQPAGHYAGNVTDAATGKVLGTLAIDVLADPPGMA